MVVLGMAPDRPRIFRRYAALSQDPFETNPCCVSVSSQCRATSAFAFPDSDLTLQLVLVFIGN